MADFCEQINIQHFERVVAQAAGLFSIGY